MLGFILAYWEYWHRKKSFSNCDFLPVLLLNVAKMEATKTLLPFDAKDWHEKTEMDIFLNNLK